LLKLLFDCFRPFDDLFAVFLLAPIKCPPVR